MKDVIKISFSTKIKSELIQSPLQNNQAMLAQFYGFIYYSDFINQEKIELPLEKKEIFLTILSYFNNFIGIQLNYELIKNKNHTYYKTLPINKNQKESITKFFTNLKTSEILKTNQSDFCRGIFLFCGNIANLKNKYYLEFIINNKQLAETLQRYLNINAFEFKCKQNETKYVIYTTNSYLIEDFLTFIGATKSSLELMNFKIYKNLRNKVNRIVNCETSNINKTVSASSYQVKCINKIISKKGLNYLDNNLKEVAEKRLQNPQMSLNELAKTFSFKISKSGLNHRLKKIEEIATKI